MRFGSLVGKLWPVRWALAISFILLSIGCAPEHTQLESDEDRDRALKAVRSNFKSIDELIFQPLCVRCHSGADAPHKIDLSSYESIMINNLFPPLIVPRNPDSSSIFTSIESGKMPKNRRRLPIEAIQAVREWILAGAPKDENSEGGNGGGEEPPE